ncbi:Bug family tripartite tricarboxylate transporter substrate binding protein [Cupriavidus sp. YAF13]|uniref:Bug family tripartite tricarboxylate transporter substrate binding protein n=1 Tax=Cupriavidus sp. YAF13 TaxID=3233075 RepID=UPI003F8F9963
MTLQHISIRRRIPACSLLLAVGALALPSGVSAQAQAWPARPLRLVVGFSAGGPTDVVARGFAAQAGKGLGQPMVVDNKPGANTIIAAQAVANATDGHTLLMAATNHTMIPALYSTRVNFDAIRSFKPVCVVAVAPTVLVVGPSLQVRTLGEFLQKAKAKPLSVTYGTPGVGSSVHFASELFAREAGIRMTAVPYKGAAQVVNDLMAGQVDASFASLGSVLPQIKAGRLTALAIASPARSAQLPDVPTFEQAGVKGYAADAWYGVLAPASMPDAHVRMLEREVQAYLAAPGTTGKLRALGLEPEALCGEEFARQIRREVATYSQIAQELGLKAD